MLTVLSNSDIVRQLCHIYFEEEKWHDSRLSVEKAIEYHTRMLERGNIISYVEGNIVVGYVEFWRITFEQFGRLVCHIPFCTDIEDTTSGSISYVANIWIHPQWRKSYVIKTLRDQYFMNNFKCEYFVGSRLSKKSQPIKVFKRDLLVSELFTKGEQNGTN